MNAGRRKCAARRNAALALLNEDYAISDRYRVVLRVLAVAKGRRFPAGLKARFVLIDVNAGLPKLLIDNHEPYGFHMHTGLPEEEDERVTLSVRDYEAALALFFSEVERMMRNEKR